MSRYFVQEVYGKRFSGVNPSQIQSIPSAWVVVVQEVYGKRFSGVNPEVKNLLKWHVKHEHDWLSQTLERN